MARENFCKADMARNSRRLEAPALDYLITLIGRAKNGLGWL